MLVQDIQCSDRDLRLLDRLLSAFGSDAQKNYTDRGNNTAMITVKEKGLPIGVMQSRIFDDLPLPFISCVYIFKPYRQNGFLKKIIKRLTDDRFFFLLRPQPFEFDYNRTGLPPVTADYINDEKCREVKNEDSSAIDELEKIYEKCGLYYAESLLTDHIFMTNLTKHFQDISVSKEKPKKE